MEKASILARISSKDESQTEVEQIPECENYVEEHDWKLFKIYQEQGSAFLKPFEEREVLLEMIEDAKKNNVKHLVFFNMDRYSRLEPDIVLEFTNELAAWGIQIHAVNGDNWSELIELLGKLDGLGFIGKALKKFLETILKGIEHQRAWRESQAKSEYVKLKVDKSGDVTISTYGNKWGCTGIPYKVVREILRDYIKSDLKLSVRKLHANNYRWVTKIKKVEKIVCSSKVGYILKDFNEFEVSINSPHEKLDLFIYELKKIQCP